MTRDEILNMPADEMMDAHIWIDVFKGGTVTGKLPPYSTDIKAAWEVVEKVRHYFVLRVSAIKDYPLVTAIFYFGDDEYFATADTAPLAICRAALLAVCVPDNA